MRILKLIRDNYYDKNSSISINPLTLKFSDKEIEKSYHTEQLESNTLIIVVGIIFTTIIFIAFAFTDQLVFPDRYLEAFEIRGYGILIIILSSLLLYMSHSEQSVEIAGFMVSLTIGVTVISIITFGIDNKNGFIYLSSVNIVLAGILTIYGAVNYKVAFVICMFMILLSFYAVVNQIDHTPLLIFIMQFISTIFIVGSGSYVISLLRRKFFLEQLFNKRLLEKVHSLNRELKEESITDPLTKLYNRRHFNNIFSTHLNSAIRKSKFISFIMIDVDNFKKYNDHYGHIQGDSVLIEVSKVLNSFTNKNTSSFRLGGEEFAILYVDSDFNSSLKLSEDILNRIRDKRIEHILNENFGIITVSMGLITIRPKGEDRCTDKIVSEADELLYKAKNSGRNRFNYKYIE